MTMSPGLFRRRVKREEDLFISLEDVLDVSDQRSEVMLRQKLTSQPTL